MEGKWNTTLFHTNIILSIVLLCVISVMLVFTRSDVRMSVGASDSTVISSTKTEAHNLNAINTSAATSDDISPATIPTITPENRQ